MRAARSWSFSARSLSSSCRRDTLNSLLQFLNIRAVPRLRSKRRVHVQLRVLGCQGLESFENFSRCLRGLTDSHTSYAIIVPLRQEGRRAGIPNVAMPAFRVPRMKLPMLRCPPHDPRYNPATLYIRLNFTPGRVTTRQVEINCSERPAPPAWLSALSFLH